MTETKANKQESRYAFKGPVNVEDEEKVDDEDGENSPRRRYKIDLEGKLILGKNIKKKRMKKKIEEIKKVVI